MGRVELISIARSMCTSPRSVRAHRAGSLRSPSEGRDNLPVSEEFFALPHPHHPYRASRASSSIHPQGSLRSETEGYRRGAGRGLLAP